MNNEELQNEQYILAERAYLNYDFGDIHITDASGIEYDGDCEYTRKIYSDEGAFTFVVRFAKNSAYIDEEYVIDQKGNIF